MSCLFGLLGGLIGVMISLNNGDEIGWSLLRGAILILVFGTISRWWLEAMATAWLESRIEVLESANKPVEARAGSRVSH